MDIVGETVFYVLVVRNGVFKQMITTKMVPKAQEQFCERQLKTGRWSSSSNSKQSKKSAEKSAEKTALYQERRKWLAGAPPTLV